MNYSLDGFETIDAETRKHCSSCGLYNTDDILARTATPEDRRLLAEKTGLDVQEITRLAGLADLVRVKGIGPRTAELLVASGETGSVQGFVSLLSADKSGHCDQSIKPSCREIVIEKANALSQRLQEFNLQHGLVPRVPQPDELAEAVEEAAELRPRLILARRDNRARFENYIQARARSSRSHLRKFSAIIIAAATVFCILGTFLVHHLEKRSAAVLYTYAVEDKVFAQSALNLATTAINYETYSLSVLFCCIIGSLAILYIAFELMTVFMNTRWLMFLFNSYDSREAYMHTAKNIRMEKRYSWINLTIVVGLFIFVLLSMYLSPKDVFVTDDLLYTMLRIIAICAVVIGLIAFIPSITLYLRKRDMYPYHDTDFIQRSLLNHLGHVVFIPFIVVVFTQFLLPLAITSHAHYYKTRLLPELTKTVMPLRTSLDSIPLLDSADMERRQKILKIIDEGIVNRLEELGLPVSEGKLDVIAEGIPLAANAVSWLALLCFALFFVIPYLLFGGWGKGLFYMIILGVAFIADKILTKTAPSWFSLKPGSAAGSFIVVFVVFANALLFDWLYDLATMRRKSCISCSSNIEEADRYCKKCGFMQI